MSKTGPRGGALLLLLTLCLGAVTGLVLWLFLTLVSLGTDLIWRLLPEKTGLAWVVLPLCAAGGCLLGLVRRRFGDYPEELPQVLGAVKRDRRYDYRPMPVMLVCALLPLILGASVGPEAGLTGIIAALCCWVGENLASAGRSAALCAELGEAVTLGSLFHMPLFGILAVEEEPRADGKPSPLPRPRKLALYGLSAAAGFGTLTLLNHLTHRAVHGFPTFPAGSLHPGDFAALLLYLPVGMALCLLFQGAEKVAQQAAGAVPPVLRETLCGAAVALMGLFAPLTIFSGEEQMALLIEDGTALSPWRLMGVCGLKLLLTAFCLRFGLKGGHFFPMIFACSSMGFGLAGLLFPDAAEHVVFAAGAVTAAALGAQMKKPLAVTVLMLLCFPPRMLLWLFLAAALGSRLGEVFSPSKKEAGEKTRT